MVYMQNKLVVKERFTRKMTTNKEGFHNLNIPDSIYGKVCNDALIGDTVNIMLLKNELSGSNVVVICGLDEYRNLINVINMEVI
jgi:hypothetical protein